MLQQMSARLRAQPDLESACRTILDDIVALHGAEFGLIQLAVEDGSLTLVDQRGFDELFVTSFRRVTKNDGTACARALRSGQAVLIEDVQTDKEFAPYRKLARKIGFRVSKHEGALMMTAMVNSVLRPLGIAVRRLGPDRPFTHITDTDLALIRRFAPYTVTDEVRRYFLIEAMRYVDRFAIPGDFVECGVWRGGSAMLAKACRHSTAPHRLFHLYDTFAGMTEPSDADVNLRHGKHAREVYQTTAKKLASLESVRQNFRDQALYGDDLVWHVGPVEETLRDATTLPDRIAVLRLDTDWYESTKIELEILYPRLAPGGVLIIDDYQSWAGAKQATDEYFAQRMPLLVPTGPSGAMLIKLAPPQARQ